MRGDRRNELGSSTVKYPPPPDHASLHSSKRTPTSALYTDSAFRASVTSSLALTLTPTLSHPKVDYEYDVPDKPYAIPTVILPTLSSLAVRVLVSRIDLYSPDCFTFPHLPLSLVRIVYEALRRRGRPTDGSEGKASSDKRGREKVPSGIGNWVHFAKEYGVEIFQEHVERKYPSSTLNLVRKVSTDHLIFCLPSVGARGRSAKPQVSDKRSLPHPPHPLPRAHSPPSTSSHSLLTYLLSRLALSSSLDLPHYPLSRRQSHLRRRYDDAEPSVLLDLFGSFSVCRPLSSLDTQAASMQSSC
jgi:hypothetical protein